MKPATLAAVLVAVFLSGAVFSYALAATEDVMNEPITITKGMWVNLVLALFNRGSHTHFSYEPSSGLIAGRTRYFPDDLNRQRQAEKANSDIAAIKALVDVAIPGSKTQVVAESKH